MAKLSIYISFCWFVSHVQFYLFKSFHVSSKQMESTKKIYIHFVKTYVTIYTLVRTTNDMALVLCAVHAYSICIVRTHTHTHIFTREK